MIALLAVLLATTEGVVAHAGDGEVTAAQLRQRIAATRAAGGDIRPELLIQDLVNETLIETEGRRLGVQLEPAVVAAVETETRKAAAERLLETAVRSIKVTDAQVLEVFHASSDSVRLQLVVLATQAEARAALERLRKGAKLADEARHSLDPDSVAAAGEIGRRSRGQLPTALASAAFAAGIGVFAGPLKLDLGFAVFKVLEREIGDPATFKAKQDELRTFAGRQVQEQMKTHFVEKLRKQAKVSVDEAFLKTTGTRLQGTPKELEHAVAAVGSRRVRFAEVAAEVRRLFGGKEAGHASGPSVKLEMAWRLVDRMLLADAAIRRGLDKDPAVRAAATGAARDAIVRLLSARLRAAAPTPEAAEVESFYQSHFADFQRPALHRCAHILVPLREEADQLRARLQRGESFAELAREHSRDPATAAAGGPIGDLPADRLDGLAKAEPALAAALRGRAGAISEPVKSRAGWHLVRCEAAIPATTAPLAEVRELIVARLTAQKGDAAVRRHIDDLRARARIEVVPDLALHAIGG